MTPIGLFSKKRLWVKLSRVAVVYDSRFEEHRSETENGSEESHPECPARHAAIVAELKKENLMNLLVRVRSRYATQSEMECCHSVRYLEILERTAKMNRRQLDKVEEKWDNDIFINASTYSCARLAMGCIIEACARLLAGEARHSLCICRPPSHHCGAGLQEKANKAMGFCFLNSVATVAKLAIRGELMCHDGCHAEAVGRVLIVDWDIHHGNGTQAILWDDPNIVYFSVHRGFESKRRWKDRRYYPGTGKTLEVGGRGARGSIINCSWSEAKMGDAEYITCWQRLLLPIAHEFSPDLILVSAGFDAAKGDPLGECEVSIDTYGHLLKPLADLAPVALILEGGYNVDVSAKAFSSCTRALLNSPPYDDSYLFSQDKCKPSALTDILETIYAQLPYWPILAEHNADILKDFEHLAKRLDKCALIEHTNEIASKHSPPKHSPEKKQNTSSIKVIQDLLTSDMLLASQQHEAGSVLETAAS